MEPLAPGPGCRFLTKVRHSAFYATPLDYLLGRLDSHRVLLMMESNTGAHLVDAANCLE